MTIKNAYAKGRRLETWMVHAFAAVGITAKRQPLSGAYGTSTGNDDLCGDVVAQVGGEPMRFECKHRANGFKTLEGWIEKHDGLLIKRDRQPPMVVLKWDTFAKLAGRARSPE